MTEKSPGWRILPPVFFLLALAAMVALHYEFPGPQWIVAPWRYAGAVVIAAALGWVIWAAVLFKVAGTAIRPYQQSTALVTSGPYRVTRNPMYLGMAAVLLGTGIFLGSAVPLAVVPLFVVLIQLRFIRMEEGMLEAAFGQEYRDYKSRVRRWI
jgi:protein-S-isoprenylcysteine O-methyltransferase Ste14